MPAGMNLLRVQSSSGLNGVFDVFQLRDFVFDSFGPVGVMQDDVLGDGEGVARFP